MRKILLSALMISLLLLCACGAASGDEARIEAFRETLRGSAYVSFTAEMRADDGQSTENYVLRCEKRDGETVMELLSPELLAGVRAHVSGKNAALEYDGLSFEAGTLTDGGVTPMSAPKLLLDALSGGTVSQLRREEYDGAVTAAYCTELGEGLQAVLRLDVQSFLPHSAELLCDGRTVITCRITDWHME